MLIIASIYLISLPLQAKSFAAWDLTGRRLVELGGHGDVAFELSSVRVVDRVVLIKVALWNNTATPQRVIPIDSEIDIEVRRVGARSASESTELWTPLSVFRRNLEDNELVRLGPATSIGTAITAPLGTIRTELQTSVPGKPVSWVQLRAEIWSVYNSADSKRSFMFSKTTNWSKPISVLSTPGRHPAGQQRNRDGRNAPCRLDSTITRSSGSRNDCKARNDGAGLGWARLSAGRA